MSFSLIRGHFEKPKNVIFTCVRPVFDSRKFRIPNFHLLTSNKATLLPFLRFVAPWQSHPTPWRFHWSRACSRATRRWSTSGRRGTDGDRRSRWFRECRSGMPNSAAECRWLRKGTFHQRFINFPKYSLPRVLYWRAWPWNDKYPRKVNAQETKACIKSAFKRNNSESQTRERKHRPRSTIASPKASEDKVMMMKLPR